MRYFSLLLLYACFACGQPTTPPADPPADRPETATPPSSAPASAPQPVRPPAQPEDVPANADASTAAGDAPGALAAQRALLDDIRTIYASIEADLEANRLQRDTFPYRCEYGPDIVGRVIVSRKDGQVVHARHGFSAGDHSGTTEQYYFDEGQLVFLFVESGHWRFGGPLQTTADGTEVPGTVDVITEERRYFHADTLVRALTKTYEIKSWEDKPDPSEIPNEVEQNPYRHTAALNVIRSTIAKERVDCEEVLHSM